ncbi:MAG: RDD family protein [Nitrospiraceae bacterium]
MGVHAIQQDDQAIAAVSEAAARYYTKAHVLNRALARCVDLLVAASVQQAVPSVGFFAGLTYLIAADGLSQGRSLGKRLVGLRTWSTARHQAASFSESIIRNLPFAVLFLLFQIPFAGWLLAAAVAGFEGLLVIGNDRGLRLGDELARTQVLESESPAVSGSSDRPSGSTGL